MNKKFLTKKEFMNLAGLNNRQRLNQLMNGYKNKKGSKEYFVPSTLKEGKDFVKTGIVFFESALEKIKTHSRQKAK